jgi:hypothetical protein
MRPEVQVLPGPPPALTSENAGQPFCSLFVPGVYRIKNAYPVTGRSHEPFGLESSRGPTGTPARPCPLPVGADGAVDTMQIIDDCYRAAAFAPRPRSTLPLA